MAFKLEDNYNVRTPGFMDQRSIPVVDKTMLKKVTAYENGPLVGGEFVYVDTDGKANRALDDSGEVDYCAHVPVYFVLSGAGRTDTLTTGKATILKGFPKGFEIDTAVMDAADLVIGSPLTVGSIDEPGTENKKAGVKLAAGDAPVIGYVTALSTTTPDGRLRFEAA